MKNEREIAREKMVSFERQWAQDVRAYFAKFAPRVDPDNLTADRSPNRRVFDILLDNVVPDPIVDARGEYLYGPSGSGKTSAAIARAWKTASCWSGTYWLKLFDAGEIGPEKALSYAKREFNAVDCQLWVASELKDAFADLAKDRDAKMELIDDLTTADVLLIDDLGHTLSPPFAENLRLIFDRWAGTDLIITSQYSLEGLVRRWSRTEGSLADMGEQAKALVCRIKDRLAVLKFADRAADSGKAQSGRTTEGQAKGPADQPVRATPVSPGEAP
jgi:hypothetical protein